MKANELMIGDWVTFKDCQHENPMSIKIIAIGFQADEENDCLVQINGDKACDIITIDDEIVGIPLTPEILEKNGFKKDTGGEECWANSKGWFTPHEYGKRDTIKSWEVEICGKINSFDGVIKYVHELQHVLRLCGIEKEIVL